MPRHTSTGQFSLYHLASLRRPTSPIAQAVAILARYGGSLWVSDPAYTFTDSDGTGAAGDNSDAGYVRDLCGNARPLTQSTTGFKPKLKRVPKKLGSALTLTAGADVGSTGRYTPNGLTGGVVASGAAYATIRHQLNLSELRNGASYQISLQAGAIGTAGGLPNVNLCDTPSYAFVNAGYISVVQSRATYDGTYKFVDVEVPASSSLTYSSLTVREVVEWTWAWVFDGVDDYMSSAASSLSQSPDYTLVVAFNSRNRSGYRLALGVFAPGGQDHMALIGEAGESPILTQYSRDISGSGGSTPSVVTGVSSSVGGRKLRKNGAVVASAAYHPLTIEPRSIRMGLGVGGDNLTGEIFAAAYCPDQLSAAELLIVERAMAQVAGVTI